MYMYTYKNNVWIERGECLVDVQKPWLAPMIVSDNTKAFLSTHNSNERRVRARLLARIGFIYGSSISITAATFIFYLFLFFLFFFILFFFSFVSPSSYSSSFSFFLTYTHIHIYSLIFMSLLRWINIAIRKCV